jgi:hypothetical protein
MKNAVLLCYKELCVIVSHTIQWGGYNSSCVEFEKKCASWKTNVKDICLKPKKSLKYFLISTTENNVGIFKCANCFLLGERSYLCICVCEMSSRAMWEDSVCVDGSHSARVGSSYGLLYWQVLCVGE